MMFYCYIVIERVVRAESVSYTHLDVYKRQERHGCISDSVCVPRIDVLSVNHAAFLRKLRFGESREISNLSQLL